MNSSADRAVTDAPAWPNPGRPSIKKIGCPSWCDVDHDALAQQAASGRADQPEPGYHSAHFTDPDEPWVEVEVTEAKGARLRVSIEQEGSMTAEQAESLGQALIRAAALLREVRLEQR